MLLLLRRILYNFGGVPKYFNKEASWLNTVYQEYAPTPISVTMTSLKPLKKLGLRFYLWFLGQEILFTSWIFLVLF